jgi:hypothetical protein
MRQTLAFSHPSSKRMRVASTHTRRPVWLESYLIRSIGAANAHCTERGYLYDDPAFSDVYHCVKDTDRDFGTRAWELSGEGVKRSRGERDCIRCQQRHRLS